VVEALHARDAMSVFAVSFNERSDTRRTGGEHNMPGQYAGRGAFGADGDFVALRPVGHREHRARLELGAGGDRGAAKP
jgi:hypothetical protein